MLYFFSIANGQQNDFCKTKTAPADPLQLTERDEILVENFHRLSDSQQARLPAYLDGLLDAGEAIKGEMHFLAEDAEREVDRIVAKELAAAKKSIAK